VSGTADFGLHDLVAGCYTISGSHAAVAGWAFTIVKGDSVTFEAGPDGLRLFVVTLDA
jgi:hypothetical protein